MATGTDRPSTRTVVDEVIRIPDEPPIERETTTRLFAVILIAVAFSVGFSLLAVVLTGATERTGTDTVAAPVDDDPGTGAAPAPRTADAISNDPADVGTPVGSRAPTTVRIELETVELEGQLADGSTYDYWTFGGTVPGPMLRVREGDDVELTLTNAADSSNLHSIDLHAVNGPGGGAVATQVAPGESATFSFEALNPGVYVYHCATPHIPTHIANGMYGLIVVEPEGGLEPVDRELYVMQGEIYTAQERGTAGLLTYDGTRATAEDPTYVVFNGAPAALTGEAAMTAEVGERVRMFVGNGGPNLTSSFHVIGEIFDAASVEGGTMVNRSVQTTPIPAGGATWVEFTIDQPGDYLLVDHAISRTIDKGALAIISATGAGDPSTFSADSPGTDATAPQPPAEAPAAAPGTVPVDMTEFAFDMPTTLPAGEHTFSVTNSGLAPHEFALSMEMEGHADHIIDTGDVAAGETVQATAMLMPGVYEVACHIPGHLESGMVTTITVTE